MPRNEVIAMALDALRAHKLRSFLTVLGVIIGVATVIAVVAVLQGFNQYMTSRVMDFGSTSFSLSKFTQGIRSMEDFLRENRRHNPPTTISWRWSGDARTANWSPPTSRTSRR